VEAKKFRDGANIRIVFKMFGQRVASLDNDVVLTGHSSVNGEQGLKYKGRYGDQQLTFKFVQCMGNLSNKDS